MPPLSIHAFLVLALCSSFSVQQQDPSYSAVDPTAITASPPAEVVWGEDVAKFKSAATLLVETAVTHLVEGFMPAVHRARRSLRQSEEAEDNFYLDTILEWMGAVMDRQKCRARLTCKAGRMVQKLFPGAQMAVLLMESVVPPNWRDWYVTVKSAIVDSSDHCDKNFSCELLPP